MKIEIKDFSGTGYMPLIDYGDWRVALINYDEKLSEENLKKMECHSKTDEVFILLNGNAVLYIGRDMDKIQLEPGKLYNVKCGTWHAISMEKETKVAVIENRDTSPQNTEYYFFSDSKK